jgi:hypothetical protein
MGTTPYTTRTFSRIGHPFIWLTMVDIWIVLRILILQLLKLFYAKVMNQDSMKISKLQGVGH